MSVFSSTGFRVTQQLTFELFNATRIRCLDFSSQFVFPNISFYLCCMRIAIHVDRTILEIGCVVGTKCIVKSMKGVVVDESSRGIFHGDLIRIIVRGKRSSFFKPRQQRHQQAFQNRSVYMNGSPHTTHILE